MTKRQEILNLIKKVLSLSLVVLIAVLSMTSCNFFPGSTVKPEYEEAEFGYTVDPDAPLTQAEIEAVEKAKDALFSFEHDLRNEGVGMIKILKPINTNSDMPCCVRIATEDNIRTHYIVIEIDKKTATALTYLSENCKDSNISGIENIEYTTSQTSETQFITVIFNDKTSLILQKYFNLIAPFTNSLDNAHLNGVDAITAQEKNELSNYLQNYLHLEILGIASVNLLKSLPTDDNSITTYALKLTDGAGIYIIDISEEQYNRFNKYLNIEKLALPKDNITDVYKKKWEQQSLKLETNHYISDTLKAQVLNDVYEIFKENNIFDVQ